MSNARKLTTGMLTALLAIGLWSAASRSQDQRRQDVRKVGQPMRTDIVRKLSPAIPNVMSADEKTVRDVYARLMRYQSAARDEQDAQASTTSGPRDYLTFELRKFQTGPLTEISGRPVADLLSSRSGPQLVVKPVYLSAAKGLVHAYYDVQWSDASAAIDKSFDQQMIGDLLGTAKRYANVDRYTSYEVKIEFKGQRRIYKALALHFAETGADTVTGANVNARAMELLDNITGEINTVLIETAPRVRSPWEKYVKTSLYYAVDRTLRAKLDAGSPLLPADAPLGYLPGDDVVPTAADLAGFTPSVVCPPQITLKLIQVGWSGTGAQTMKKTGSGPPGSDWENDTFFSEGDTTIVNPVWVDSNTDGTPNENEPVAYIKGSSPKLTGIKVTITPSQSTNVNAKIKVESGTELRFTVQDVVLKGSSITLSDFSTGDNVGTKVNNRTYTLHWSVSFDNGATYTEFAASKHKAFVTVGAPSGYPGNSEVTAKRIDRVTTTVSGLSSLVDIASAIGASVEANPGFHLGTFFPDSSGLHWKALDDHTPADCISLAVLAVKELRMIGINASQGRAFPTGGAPSGDTDAGAAEFDSMGRELEFFAAGGANVFEGFFEITDGTTRKAFTVDPTLGPVLETTRPVSGDKLKYNMIKTTLDVIKAGNPTGHDGRQYWFGTSFDFSHEVPFPVP